MSWRLAGRILPNVFLILLTIFGLLFADQVKWFQDNTLPPVEASHTARTHARALPIYPFIVIIVGIITLIASTAKDVKEQQNEPGHLSEEKFLEFYTEALSSTLEYLPLASIFTPADSKDAITNILKNVINIAEAYKNDDVEHNQAMNACWYKAIDPAELTETQSSEVARFMDNARNTYDKFLVLSEWGYLGGELVDPNNKTGPKHEKPCVDIGFTLPVDHVSQYTLPGAPETYNSREITVVPDISTKESLKRLSGMNYAPVHNEMWNFFRDRQTYTSFVSLPVVVGEQIYGVISIQSKRKNFCHLNSTHDQNMFKSLKPFLVALALLESYSSN